VTTTTTRKLWADLETFSEVPLKSGTHRYAEKAEVLLFAYALDDGPVKCWDVAAGEKIPSDLYDAAHDPAFEVWFHNVMFDRTVLRHAMPWFFAAVPLERWRCSMARALAHGLPGSLDTLCEIFNLPQDQRKLKIGRTLVRLFCIPPAKNLKRGRATARTHPVEWAQFVEYAKLDIASMRAIGQRMPTWNYQAAELALWHLDQRINERGVLVDVDLAHAAIRAVERAQKRLAARTVELTNGDVQRATQRDALLAHLLCDYGVDLPDLQKSTLERRIEDASLPWALRELLAIRLQSATTSTSKYKTLINGASRDHRLRGLLQFCGASRTGRWAGRLWQPQNLMRPTLKQAAIDAGIEAMKADCEDLVTDNVMELASSAMRGCIVPTPGKKLVVADLSNIEGRKLAWLAGEKWKLRAFADYDTVLGKDGKWYTGPEFYAACLRREVIALELDSKGEPVRKGHDLYKLAYSKSFGIRPEDVTKDQRQVGKVQELALGYEGGVGAFLTFAAAYNLDLEAMAEEAESAIPADIWDEAAGMLDWTKRQRRSTFGLSDRAFMVCESFKRSWRQAHPEVVQFWRDLGDMVRAAINRPGVTFDCRRLKIRRDGAWLRIRLPSGRFLCYPSPQVGEDNAISYMGVNQYSRKWSRIKTYGGKLAENVTQAASRDVIAHNMPSVEAAGYDILLTVHDEDITEAPDEPEFNPEHLASLIAANPPWAAGLPLAAAGFESYRYKKD
jgi:DNA polymerase